MARSLPDPERIRQSLDDADGLDASRVKVVVAGDVVLLRGRVASSEEATVAALAADAATDGAAEVIDEIQIDRGLREGDTAPPPGEPATPRSDEVLVGSTDMLAGPDSPVVTDVDQALEESEPWSPPEHPHIPEPPRPDRGTGDPGVDVTGAEARSDVEDPVTHPDHGGIPLPAEPGPGSRPDDLDEHGQVRRVPGTEAGPGATGEGTAGGGGTAGTPATETGATGADTERADPARTTGGAGRQAGTHRGPEAEDDPAIRDEFPKDD